jgi:hypothetical protein
MDDPGTPRIKYKLAIFCPRKHGNRTHFWNAMVFIHEVQKTCLKCKLYYEHRLLCKHHAVRMPENKLPYVILVGNPEGKTPLDWPLRRYEVNIRTDRCQWPRGLRRGSAAARLLGLWVRIPPGHGCLSLVSVVCCQVEVCATGWSLVQRGPTECGVSECDREASIMRKPWPTTGCCSMEKKNDNRFSKSGVEKCELG